MAEFTNVAEQTVAANGNIVFSETAVKGCSSIVHREGSGIITLRGASKTQNRARFKAEFNANVQIPTGGAVSPITVSLALNGESVQATQMIVTPAAVENYWNVASSIYIDVPKCCCTQLSVENNSTQAIEVSNANIIVERVA